MKDPTSKKKNVRGTEQKLGEAGGTQQLQVTSGGQQLACLELRFFILNGGITIKVMWIILTTLLSLYWRTLDFEDLGENEIW